MTVKHQSSIIINLSHVCPNEAYDEFIKLYKQIFETCFPLRTCKINNTIFKKELSVTAGILISSKQNPTADNIAAYKEYSNMFNRLKQAIQINYFQNALEESKQNERNTWSILRKATGKSNNKTSFPPPFLINGILISDKFQIAESFNNFVSKIGIQTNQNMPQSNKHLTEYMPKT